ALAKEVGPSGVRVNCIAPGVINTRMNAGLGPEDLRALKEETPLGRLGTPEDIAAAVSFLASPGAGFVTGQVLGVNGGIVI
ncbi:MAG TPA: 3-oxoacyl-ACP reductase, partial [Ruminococcaceae bacterium]|nr:3-oxoacyl-ACP reductase [Oscillospiraceae bacterium]